MAEQVNISGVYPDQYVIFDNQKLTGYVESPNKNGYFATDGLFAPPEIEFSKWNQSIDIDFIDNDNENVAIQVANFLSSGRISKDWRFMKQRPYLKCPYSRSLEVLLPEGKVLVIGGVLVQCEDLQNCDEWKLECKLPNPKVSLNDSLSNLGLKKQGYTSYDPITGKIEDVDSDGSILGGYTKEGLDNKIAQQTIAERVIGDLDVVIPHTIISGSYGNLDLGAFYAYLKPVTLDAGQMVAIDTKFKESALKSSVFPNAMYSLAKLVRQMHDRNFIHFQLHSGNWGLSTAIHKGDSNKLYIGDYETECFDPNMPLEPKIIDLLILFNNITNPTLKGSGSIFQDEEYFDRSVHSLVTGYFNKDLTMQQVNYMNDKFRSYKRKSIKNSEEMVYSGQKYLSWALGKVYPDFDLMKYLIKYKH